LAGGSPAAEAYFVSQRAGASFFAPLQLDPQGAAPFRQRTGSGVMCVEPSAAFTMRHHLTPGGISQ